MFIDLCQDKQDIQLTSVVAAVQAGQTEAFGLLVERYQRSVYATAYRRLGNHAEAQELSQEVFIQALRKIDQLRDAHCFGGWLRSMTNRMAINRAMRRVPSSVSSPNVFDATCVENRTPLGNMLDRERAGQVRSGLRRLRAMDRETLEAFYFDGRTLIEMSKKFSSPVGTIKRRLHTARKRLAKELKELAAV
jgi:RNA polymerase sigma-70 factor, ECF subfamily